MNYEDEMQNCDTLEINQDVIHSANKIKQNYLKTKDTIFQEIYKDIFLIIEKDKDDKKILKTNTN